MIDYSNALGGGTATLYYIHTDHRQAPWMVSDATGHVRWGKSSSLDPYPWTAPSNWADSIEMNLRLPGQIYLAELGLNYNYFRDYDPDIGRYLQSDPIGLAGGINTYVYANNNPLRYVDPSGLVFGFGDNASLNFGFSIAVPLSPTGLGIGGGAGLTLRRCCTAQNTIANELFASAGGGPSLGLGVALKLSTQAARFRGSATTLSGSSTSAL